MGEMEETWRTLIPGDVVVVNTVPGVVLTEDFRRARSCDEHGETVMRVTVRLRDGRKILCEYLFGRPQKTIRPANPLDLLAEI